MDHVKLIQNALNTKTLVLSKPYILFVILSNIKIRGPEKWIGKTWYYTTKHNECKCLREFSHSFTYIWVTVFKDGPRKLCGRQPLKNLKWYGLRLSRLPWPISNYRKKASQTITSCLKLLPSFLENSNNR